MKKFFNGFHRKKRSHGNIIRIIVSDGKRIALNVTALIVIIGLSVIPCLYAWFNILSNWDPYGEEATGRLSVAVANEDEGDTIGDFTVNIGDIIVENLKQNDTIKWVFCDTAAEAEEGVRSGDYYAAIIVTEEFSQDMLSFIGGDLEHPTLTYLENEKKNAIAPKITGKVKTTIQAEVNKAFVSSLTSGFLQAGEYITGSDSESESFVDYLKDLEEDLDLGITILDSYIALMDTMDNLSEASEAVSDQLAALIESGEAIADTAGTVASAADDTADTISDITLGSIYDVTNSLNTLRSTVAGLFANGELSADVAAAQAAGLQAVCDALTAQVEAIAQNETVIANNQEEVDQVVADLDQLSNDIAAVQSTLSNVGSSNDAEVSQLLSDVDQCISSADALYSAYSNNVKPQTDETLRQVKNALAQAEKLLRYTDGSVEEVTDILSNYKNVLNSGEGGLEDSRDMLVSMRDQLQELINEVEDVDENDQYQMLLTLLREDPDSIADFISKPTEVDTEAIYPVDYNGSAMAPFYVVLSIWVGALILVAIVRTEVSPIEGVINPRNYETFFGRYVFFFLIGQLQTFITVMGCFFFIGIQCEHPVLFLLACQFCALVFTLLLYSLKYAFGAVGEAIAVILMVVQVAGSGGTFPVEVLPVAYQIFYKLMPFPYIMDALKECIAGMYGNNYWVYLAELAAFIPVALFIGLLLGIPFKGLAEKVKEGKEKTGLMV